jgi:VIT1/CCC1 family predicted Fe2+/Mn2+ transporter
MSLLNEILCCVIRGLSTGIGAALLVAAAFTYSHGAAFLAATCGAAGLALIAFGMWESEAMR